LSKRGWKIAAGQSHQPACHQDFAALALALSACEREPSFDERYSHSADEIEEKARELDAQLNNAQGSNAAEARTQ
jgi:hypothetical protein